MRQNILIKCFVWAIYISSILSSAAQEPFIEVAFFNVGQGNCTIIKAPDKKNVWIIDAGSKQNPTNILDNDSFIQKDIVTAIAKWLGSLEGVELHVVLSHPDEDHYNLIPTLRENYGNIKIKYYISDKYFSAAYGSSTFKGIQDTDILRITYSKEGLPKLPPLKKRGGSIPRHEVERYIIEQGNDDKKIRIEFLNAGVTDKAGQKKNTNLHSLVVKVSYGQHSVLLTGDATAQTYSDIEEHPLSDALKDITILQSSHHGAKTEGSNTKHFIELTNPHYVVFSAPRYSAYEHPNTHIVERYVKFFQEKDTVLQSYHLFFLNKNITPLEMKHNLFISHRGEFTPVLTYRKHITEQPDDLSIYVISATNYPIFHTGSHGTIIFKWELRGDVESNFYDYDKDAINTASAQDSTLKKTTDNICINSKNIDAKLFEIIKKSKYDYLGIRASNDLKFIQYIIENDKDFSYLQAIYAERSPTIILNNKEIFKKAIKNLPSLQLFSVNDNQLPKDYNPSILEKRFLGLNDK